MKCVICKQGETRAGATTLTFTRDSTTLVVKNVPAQVCVNCGEAYVDEVITARLLATADEAVRTGVRMDVREYVIS